MGNEPVSGYADVNGLRMYYEVHGEDGRWSCCTALTRPPTR